MNEDFLKERENMIATQIVKRGVMDNRVLQAIQKVPRHLFVSEEKRNLAYEDRPIPIGFGQTISQPYMVAYMTEQLSLTGTERVLEIGTGCGYQTAILAELAKEVYSIEIVSGLCELSKTNLEKLDYSNIHLKYGDGYFGWSEYAPFDVILVAAAPEKVPSPLKDQLKIGGKLIIPIGKGIQFLYIYHKTQIGFYETKDFGVIFVPMTGKVQE